MNNAARFSDKMAIVTGAASGIGRATLLRLVGEGATVLASDINTSGLGESLELAKAAADHGGSATSCVVSVTDEAAVRRCVADFVAEYGKLDVLINMAGVLQSSHTTETSLADFMAIVEVIENYHNE